MLHNGHRECSGRLVPKNPSPTLAFHNCPRVRARQQGTPASRVECLVCGAQVSALPSYGSTILCSHRANSHTLPMLAPASGFLGLCELPFPGSAQPETLQQLTLTEPLATSSTWPIPNTDLLCWHVISEMIHPPQCSPHPPQ